LQHHILERIAHVTALVECVARTISETVRARDLWEPREHAKLLHPRQESGVWQLLVWRDLPPVERLDGLAEDGDVGLFRFQH